jgi:hypothetical protein
LSSLRTDGASSGHLTCSQKALWSTLPKCKIATIGLKLWDLGRFYRIVGFTHLQRDCEKRRTIAKAAHALLVAIFCCLWQSSVIVKIRIVTIHDTPFRSTVPLIKVVKIPIGTCASTS